MFFLKSNEKFVAEIAEGLANKNYIFVSGGQVAKIIDAKEEEISEFKKYWDDLVSDCYMADGGQYRYRRYGQFSKLANKSDFLILPHAPYVQSSDINSLNGDVERNFEPLKDDFVSSDLLINILILLGDIYDAVEKKPRNWNVRLHPYRIIANELETGQPTLEGLHRDGVAYIASVMVCRHNISGGVTTITDKNKNFLEEALLSDSLDIVMADDEETMHKVSSIKPLILDEIAYRDVLVIAFTRDGE